MDVHKETQCDGQTRRLWADAVCLSHQLTWVFVVLRGEVSSNAWCQSCWLPQILKTGCWVTSCRPVASWLCVPFTMGGSHRQVGPLLFQTMVSEQENVKIRSYMSQGYVCVRSSKSGHTLTKRNWESRASHHFPLPSKWNKVASILKSAEGKCSWGRERSWLVRVKVSKGWIRKARKYASCSNQ